MIITATKIMRTETAHRLTNYSGRCSHLHGHSYRWEVTAGAPELDERGMIIDFGDLKKAMHKVLDPWDHALILHNKDPMVIDLENQRALDLLNATNGEAARLFVYNFNPTAENLARYSLNLIKNELPLPIFLVKMRVFETESCYVDVLPRGRNDRASQVGDKDAQ